VIVIVLVVLLLLLLTVSSYYEITIGCNVLDGCVVKERGGVPVLQSIDFIFNLQSDVTVKRSCIVPQLSVKLLSMIIILIIIIINIMNIVCIALQCLLMLVCFFE